MDSSIPSQKSSDEDDISLLKLGYASELRRGLGSITNSAFGFNSVAVLSGIAVVYGHALTTGGPVVIIWGFIASFIATYIICLCMAELASAYPAAGGVYNWAAQVVPSKYAPLAAYMTGWLNLFGYVMATCVIAATFGGFASAASKLSFGHSFSKGLEAPVAIAAVVFSGLLNIMRIDELGAVNTFLGLVQLSTMIILVVVLLVLPHKLNSPEQVFFGYHNETGFQSQSYVVAIGLLLPAFCFNGYDGSSQMSEETKHANVNAPRGIIRSCLLAGFGGLAVLIALLFASLDIDAIVEGDTEFAIMNVFALYLDSAWAQALAWLLVVNIFFGTTSCVAVSGRIAFALARDHALPFSALLAHPDPTLKTPVYAIFFTVLFAISLLLFLLDPNARIAFVSMVGLSVAGLQFSYALPILLRIVFQSTLPVNPFSLGVFSIPLGVIAVTWLVSIAILAFFPVEYPVTAGNMNWSCVVAAAYFLISSLNWIFNSRFTFKGPHRYHDDIVATPPTPKTYVGKSNIRRNSYVGSPRAAGGTV